jgi:hypothetical protein
MILFTYESCSASEVIPAISCKRMVVTNFSVTRNNIAQRRGISLQLIGSFLMWPRKIPPRLSEAFSLHFLTLELPGTAGGCTLGSKTGSLVRAWWRSYLLYPVLGLSLTRSVDSTKPTGDTVYGRRDRPTSRLPASAVRVTDNSKRAGTSFGIWFRRLREQYGACPEFFSILGVAGLSYAVKLTERNICKCLRPLRLCCV